MLFPPTIIIRHKRENLKKCSLRGLENRQDFLFYTFPPAPPLNLENYLMLHLEAPPLSIDDAGRGLLVLDGTWRYAAQMFKPFQSEQMIYRSLPSHFRTAYPRRQADCPDPERGLASIEAIYLSYQILGRDTSGLLDHYYWKEQFLTINSIN